MLMANAHATQLEDEVGKSNWMVKSEKGLDIFTLDKKMTEKQVMSAIHMARAAETKAYAEGLDTARKDCEKKIAGIMERGQAQINELNKRIDGLNAELLRLMGELEDDE